MLCQGCFTRIVPGEIPLCTECYDQLLAAPLAERIRIIAELRRSELLRDFLDQLSVVIDSSKRTTCYRSN